MKKWKVEQSETIFERPIFQIDELKCTHPTLSPHDFTVMKTRDWINVVAETEDNNLIMVKQHRLGTDELTIETPAGLMESGESPRESALRELTEETGYEAGEIVSLGKLKANPAIMNTTIHYFYAKECKRVMSQSLDDSEDIEIVVMPVRDVKKAIVSGLINHSVVVSALAMYFLHLEENVS